MGSLKTLGQLRNALPVALGAAIYAFGLHYFVIPNELMEGGITGIALLLNYALGIPPSITTLCINVPLFIVGWKSFGKETMMYTIIGTLSLAFFLWVMESFIRLSWLVPFTTEKDYILAALYAGVTLGAGLGIVFRFGGTTGGSDIIARIASKNKRWSMGQVILTFDAAVIACSLFYIPQVNVLYTLVAVFITSRMIDFITEGAYSAKAFTIITDRAEIVAQAINQEMNRGATLIPARGSFSQQNKQIIYCIVSRQETRKLRSIVKEVDPKAFIVISDVHDVLGEGFSEDR